MHPLHERDWSMGKKSGILLELAVLLLLLPSQYSEVSWLLSFSMVMHWPYIICEVWWLCSELNVMCTCAAVRLHFFPREERVRDLQFNSPRGMEEKSACMGCSCWPFAIITLIKVESWYGCMEWIPSFLFIMTPILDRLWHADTWVRWCGCVLLLGAGLVWLGVSGSDTLFMCQHGWVHSTSVFYLHASAVF